MELCSHGPAREATLHVGLAHKGATPLLGTQCLNGNACKYCVNKRTLSRPKIIGLVHNCYKYIMQY